MMNEGIMGRTEKIEPYQIIWLVRRLFRAMAQKSTENLEGLGVSVADRAVLEFLHPDKRLTVPEIAERYQVTRQHVQVTVNSLLDKALVITEPNPRHKRSSLIVLNDSGRRLFASILAQDKEAFEVLFAEISTQDIRITAQTLQSLLNKLN